MGRYIHDTYTSVDPTVSFVVNPFPSIPRASLADPDKLFNAGLQGNAWRAIDFFEGDKIKERALKNLVRAAVDYNQMKLKSKAPAGTRAKVHKK
jgi:hypothetical protein